MCHLASLQGPYDKTLLLPKTKFPMRANAAQREPKIAACFQDVYKWQRAPRDMGGAAAAEGATPPQFIMHDGPPFANGPPHMGHALNKILKDIINRYQMLRGRYSYFCFKFRITPSPARRSRPAPSRLACAACTVEDAVDVHACALANAVCGAVVLFIGRSATCLDGTAMVFRSRSLRSTP